VTPGPVEHGFRSHVCGIRPGHRLCEGEGRNRFPRHQGKILTFLILVPEEENRHGDADGLRHSHGQRENVAPAGDQCQDATVIRVGEALPTVLLRNFHSECTKIEQPLNHRFGNFRLTFDGFSIDVVPQKHLDLLAVRITGRLFLRWLRRGEQQGEVRPSVIQAGQKTAARQSFTGFFDLFESFEEGAHMVPHPLMVMRDL
jgi:hypothetical protein